MTRLEKKLVAVLREIRESSDVVMGDFRAVCEHVHRLADEAIKKVESGR